MIYRNYIEYLFIIQILVGTEEALRWNMRDLTYSGGAIASGGRPGSSPKFKIIFLSTKSDVT
jgi:hypothetical protein